MMGNNRATRVWEWMAFAWTSDQDSVEQCVSWCEQRAESGGCEQQAAAAATAAGRGRITGYRSLIAGMCRL